MATKVAEERELHTEIAFTEKVNAAQMAQICRVYSLEFRRVAFNAKIDPLLYTPAEVDTALAKELKEVDGDLLKFRTDVGQG